MRILIIEDEAPDRRRHREIVESLFDGAEIMESASLNDALNKASTTKFDIVLCDLKLDTNSNAGEEVITALQSKGSLAIVVISGLDADTFRARIFRAGIWDYFQKPVDEAALRLVLKRIHSSLSAPKVATWVPSVPNLTWDVSSLAAPKWRGNTVSLSQANQRILLELLKTPGKVVKHVVLFDVMDNSDRSEESLASSLTSAIYQIRKAFKELDPSFGHLVSMPSVGYVWHC